MKNRIYATGIWVGVVLTSVFALLLGVYFLLTSTRIAQEIEVSLNEDLAPGVISFDSIQFGPGVGEVHVVGLSINGMDGQPIVDMNHLGGTLSLGSLISGDSQGMVFDTLLVEGFGLALDWTDGGRFLFTETFKGRAKSLKPPKKKLLPEMLFREVVLKNGTLTTGTGVQGATLTDILVQGTIAMGPEYFDLDAALQSQGGFLWRTSRDAAGDESRWVYPLKEARVEGFSMRKGGYRATDVEILSEDGSVSLSPDVVVGPSVSAEIGFRFSFPESLVSGLTEEEFVADVKSAGRFYWKGSSWKLDVDDLSSSTIRVGKAAVRGLISHGRIGVESDGIEVFMDMEAKGMTWKHVEIGNPAIQLSVDGEMTVPQRNALVQASKQGLIQLWSALGQIGRLRIQLGPSAARSIKTNDWFVRGLRTRRVQLLYGATGANEFTLELGRLESDEDRGIYADAIVMGNAKVFLPGVKGKVTGKAALFGNVTTEGFHIQSSLGSAGVDAKVAMGIRGAKLRTELEVTDADLRSLKPALEDKIWEQLGLLKEGKIQGRLVLDGDLLKKGLPGLTSAAIEIEREGKPSVHLMAGAGENGPDATLGPWKFQRDEEGR